jgi:aminoglycoside phosphotransferase (APT) family kinase protein
VVPVRRADDGEVTASRRPDRAPERDATPAAHAFRAHVAERAGDWFPELGAGGARVSLRREDARAYSTMYEFVIDGGAAPRSVLVKQPAARERSERPRDAPIRDRPRRAAVLDPARKSEAEFAALEMLHAAFGRLDDPRFGTVAPLDFVRPQQALVMEKVESPRLTEILMRGRRGPGSRPGDALAPLRTAGAWLRACHALDGSATSVRHATRDEFVAYIAAQTRYLAADRRHAGLLDRVGARVETAAAAVLSAELPLGTTHGDFAPRNVLVGPGARVTVIDTLARWRAPIYEDLGDFLFALTASKPQVYAQGTLFAAPVLAAWEDAFLDGYFGAERRPYRALRLFEAQALLDRWASAHRATLGATGAAAVESRARMALITRYLSRRLKRLCGAFDQEDHTR